MSLFPNLFHRVKQSFLIIYVLSCSCPFRTKSSALPRQIFASFYRNNLSIFYIDIHWAAGRTDTTDCFFYLFLSMFFLTQYRSSLFRYYPLSLLLFYPTQRQSTDKLFLEQDKNHNHRKHDHRCRRHCCCQILRMFCTKYDKR